MGSSHECLWFGGYSRSRFWSESTVLSVDGEVRSGSWVWQYEAVKTGLIKHHSSAAMLQLTVMLELIVVRKLNQRVSTIIASPEKGEENQWSPRVEATANLEATASRRTSNSFQTASQRDRARP